MNVLLERDGPVGVVTLNRPERLNAVDRSIVLELVAALDEADANPEVKTIVITGAGRAFCAGADLTNGADTFALDLPDSTVDDFRDWAGIASLRVFESNTPVIGAINGPAVGFGASFACALDLRFAARSASFSFAFARRGMVAEGASSWFLPRLVGPGRALEWTLSGRSVDADEALAAGLVNHVAENALDAAIELGVSIASNNAPVAVAITRQLMWRGLVADHPADAHRVESRATWERGRSRDVAEGITSFLEKRPARFPQSLDELSDLTPWTKE